MSAMRRARKFLGKKKIERRNLNPQELKEIQGLTTVANNQHWRATQIAGNTAMIHNGQEVAKSESDIAKVLENAKTNWVTHKMIECGVTPGQAVNINMETGAIIDAGSKEKLEPIDVKVESKV